MMNKIIEDITQVTVDVSKSSYNIHIGNNLLQSDFFLNQLGQLNIGKQIVIISNPEIEKNYLPILKDSLGNKYNIINISIPAGEEHKNLNTISTIYDRLIVEKFNRKSTIIALGGGVIGDMSGFAASTWMRGINYIQIPTTLLAQVDSSVGGKTGVNHPIGKNMIGAFYHPKIVITDLSTLKTLPVREFNSGMAEVIKYGLIYDLSFFEWIEKNAELVIKKDSEALSYAVKRSCEVKADVVSKDENEQNLRAILNFGHTFGHALEAITSYTKYKHGEAIAIGMVKAAILSQNQGYISQVDVERIISIFQKFQLPIESKNTVSNDSYLKHMLKDKKSNDQGLSLILLKKLGQAMITKSYSSEALLKILEDL